MTQRKERPCTYPDLPSSFPQVYKITLVLLVILNKNVINLDIREFCKSCVKTHSQYNSVSHIPYLYVYIFLVANRSTNTLNTKIKKKLQKITKKKKKKKKK